MTAVAAGVIDHSRGWGDDQMTTVVSLVLPQWQHHEVMAALPLRCTCVFACSGFASGSVRLVVNG